VRDAVRARAGDRADVSVLEGDAKSAAHLDQIAALLNPKALLIASFAGSNPVSPDSRPGVLTRTP
jgi:hypothetical protein